MPTERLYYHDSYLTRFTASVVSARQGRDETEVVLDRTAFYPEGGGQPSDLGTLAGLPVVGVVEREGEVIHRVQGASPRGEVVGQVDWERRFDHMQQHTGQHLLSQAFERLLGTSTVSFHMGAESCNIDLALSTLSSTQVESVEELVNRVVLENRPVLLHLVDPSELASFQLRKGTERKERVRLVEVSNFDTIPCGGTHCRSTCEVGPVKVVRWERRGGNTRVEFLCGGRALRDYRAKSDLVVGLAAALSVRDREVRDAVERLQRESAEARRQVGHLKGQLLQYRAEELARGARPVGQASVIPAVLPEAGPEDLKHMAAHLTAEPGRVALLAATTDRVHLVFARSDDLSFDASALLRQVCTPLGGRGGGRPNLAQGGLPEPEGVRAALDEALKVLSSLLAV